MAIAILVVGACVALVLDTLWIQNAHLELQQVADASALSAAGQLACDELLLPSTDSSAVADRVRQAAANLAAHSRVSGRYANISPLSGVDVHLGKIILPDDAGEPQFLEVESGATSVVVFAHCDSRHGNPIPLFFSHLTGKSQANAIARAEASVNNRLLGVRPLDNAPVPALPLGILEAHTDPRRTDTWIIQVEGHQGTDNYRFDADSNSVVSGSDGLPEIVLHSTLRGNEEEEEKRGNVQLLDFGTNLRKQEVLRQIQSGWRWQDLVDFGSEFRTDSGPVSLRSIERIEGSPVDALQSLVGQVRIVALYRATGPGLSGGSTRASVQRLVAVRIMSVRQQSTSLEMTVQPAVIATRTALVDESLVPQKSVIPNPYIYRISLTY